MNEYDDILRQPRARSVFRDIAGQRDRLMTCADARAARTMTMRGLLRVVDPKAREFVRGYRLTPVGIAAAAHYIPDTVIAADQT